MSHIVEQIHIRNQNGRIPLPLTLIVSTEIGVGKPIRKKSRWFVKYYQQ